MWLWVTVIVCGVAGAFLSALISEYFHFFLIKKRQIVILSTSIGGSYICVKLVGSMIGNYPDEMVIAQKIKNGEFETVIFFRKLKLLDASYGICLYWNHDCIIYCWNYCTMQEL